MEGASPSTPMAMTRFLSIVILRNGKTGDSILFSGGLHSLGFLGSFFEGGVRP
jgi:hypothetical protein